jgi:murein DD-endopeptidase MepM/ murein hydrolase activator NlpD
MVRCYNTEPYRRQRQDECWKLFLDARLLVSTAGCLTVGTGYVFPIAAADFQWCGASNYLTKYSGGYEWGEPTHCGLDIELPIGSPVVSCCAGTVVFVGPYKDEDETGSPGLGAIVHGEDNVVYGYWHLSTCDVGAGEAISEGRLLGSSGNSGIERIDSMRPHLHIEMALLQGPRTEYERKRGRDYDAHLKPLWVPEGGFLINPAPYLREWYAGSRRA